MSDLKGLSILIPVYNYHAYPLVKALSDQAQQLSLPYEILCYDDGSQSDFKTANRSLAPLPGVTYRELPENIGRSRIRNKLARESQYDTLLFIDGDSGIIKNDYLRQYAEASAEHPVVAGGTAYTQAYDPAFSLRLKYGKEREQQSCRTRSMFPYRYINLNNLVVRKKIFLENQLDESLSTYGHEDTKFGYFLKDKKIPVLHIDNPVDHCGLEDNRVYLHKTKEGIKNFYRIIREGYGRDTKLYKTYSLLKRLKLTRFFRFFYRCLRPVIEKNLLSETPSLFYFDLFKLDALLDQEKNSRVRPA